jgi:NitT/TauT family transport system substrate-binding protein
MGLRRSAAVALTLSLTLTAAVGCTDSPGDESGGEKVKYLTSFNAFGREAYAFVALEKGYFREAGFDVDISLGTGTVDVLKLIAGGQADFGVGDFTATLLTMGKEKLPVTAVGMIHQRTLAAIVALEGSGISTAKDLAGKKIGDQPGSTNQLMFPLFAEKAGFDAKTVTFVAAKPPALPQLLVAGKVDGIGQFVVGEPLIEKASKGRPAVVLPYGEMLPGLYGNALVTTRDKAGKDPEKVKKFTAALLKGLEYAIENPREAAQILKKHQPTQDPGVAQAELELMAKYVKPDDFVGQVGAVDPARVDEIIGILTNAKAIPAGSVTQQDAIALDVIPKP